MDSLEATTTAPVEEETTAGTCSSSVVCNEISSWNNTTTTTTKYNNEEEIIIVETNDDIDDASPIQSEITQHPMFYFDDSQTDAGDDIHYTTSLLASNTNNNSNVHSPYGVRLVARKIGNILQTSVSRTISGGKSLLGAVRKPLMTGNDEHFEVIITDPNNVNSEIMQFNTMQRKVFNLSAVYSKVIGWRKKATRQIRRRINNYDDNYLHPPTQLSDNHLTRPFRKRKRKVPTCSTCIIPQEIWAYNVLPYMSWTDKLIMRIVSKMFLIMVQEQDETWSELFEAKSLKYFGEPTDLWKNTHNYFYYDLDEAIVKQYFEEVLFERYRKIYRHFFNTLKLSYQQDSQAIISSSHTNIERQESFISYLSSSRSISERKKQVNQRKNLSQQELLKSVEHRSK
ncbi:predicted protein [Naegleria gruberi]|uniref:Predicted protein n=1 Tax=Naegleria gruberi TaxID=5762 RepID=D2UYA7_NAEGR|nr:uncharacterized protein NAEGRDRAFT_45132 [Naegleria gruberi]EFC50440.1 predicted protein [Naegleria gruberi]|eukprot:XP_002683184.1 predicted protein [Naegleria gruberi strain NEG-M]